MPLSEKQIDRLKFLLREVWESTDDKKTQIGLFRDELANVQSAEELHQFALCYNWDDGAERLESVINHPLCDQGTALLVFWVGEPWCFYAPADRPAAEHGSRPTYNLLKLIEQKYLANEFKKQTIKVDPSKIDGLNYLKIQADWQREGYKWIPLGMTWPSSGQTVARLKGL
jgi:hypothetical protein